MTPFQFLRGSLLLSTICWLAGNLSHAGEINPTPPRAYADRTTNGAPRFVFPYPSAQSYTILSAAGATNSFGTDTFSGRLLGPTFIITNPGPLRFYKVIATPMASNDIFAATVLNRLCYGPTPADIDRIRAIGPQAFINEQMAAEGVPDTVNTDAPVVNVPIPLTPPNPLTNWIH